MDLFAQGEMEQNECSQFWHCQRHMLHWQSYSEMQEAQLPFAVCLEDKHAVFGIFEN